MILLIDNYDSFTYNLYQMMAPHQRDICVVRNDQINLEDIAEKQPSHIILSPGPGRPEQAGICLELVKHYSGRIPILGVCLGHQVIAEAFGGEIVLADSVVHGQHDLIFHSRKTLYRDMALPCKVGRYHSLVVNKDNFPSQLLIEAETPSGIVMGLRHISHPTFGVQFHPESILTEQGGELLSQFLSISGEA